MITIEKETCLLRGMSLFVLFVKKGNRAGNTALFGKEDI